MTDNRLATTQFETAKALFEPFRYAYSREGGYDIDVADIAEIVAKVEEPLRRRIAELEAREAQARADVDVLKDVLYISIGSIDTREDMNRRWVESVGDKVRPIFARFGIESYSAEDGGE